VGDKARPPEALNFAGAFLLAALNNQRDLYIHA